MVTLGNSGKSSFQTQVRGVSLVKYDLRASHGPRSRIFRTHWDYTPGIRRCETSRGVAHVFKSYYPPVWRLPASYAILHFSRRASGFQMGQKSSRRLPDAPRLVFLCMIRSAKTQIAGCNVPGINGSTEEPTPETGFCAHRGDGVGVVPFNSNITSEGPLTWAMLANDFSGWWKDYPWRCFVLGVLLDSTLVE